MTVFKREVDLLRIVRWRSGSFLLTLESHTSDSAAQLRTMRESRFRNHSLYQGQSQVWTLWVKHDELVCMLGWWGRVAGEEKPLSHSRV